MAELNRQVNDLLYQILGNKSESNLVAETIKAEESQQAEQAYKMYRDGKPWTYERRGKTGGLADMENMYETVSRGRSQIKMLVENLTPPHKKYNDNELKVGDVAKLVEGGHRTDYKYTSTTNWSDDADDYLRPRPFQKWTVESLKRSGLHALALSAEFKQKGINSMQL